MQTSEWSDFWLQADTPMPPAIEKIEPSEQAPHVAAEAVINGMLTGMARPKKVDKWWGYELHYRNDSMYCMKLLHFDKGGATSMHFHVGKHETLLVVNGILTVATKYDKKLKYRRLEPGQALVVAPGFVHRLIAAEGPVDLVEASTYDHDDDSVRVA